MFVVSWVDGNGLFHEDEVDGSGFSVVDGILYVQREGTPVAAFAATTGWTIREKG